MFDPSPTHILLFLLVVLVVFGARRVPDVARSLGRGVREFRGAITGEPEREPAGAAVEPPLVAGRSGSDGEGSAEP